MGLSISDALNNSFNDAGWIRSGDNFYLISQEKMNWFEARQFCQDHHGFLAEIKSDEEQQNVNQILPDGRYYWIGLEDFTEEGKFIWDYSKEDMSFLTGEQINLTIGMMEQMIVYPCIQMVDGMI